MTIRASWAGERSPEASALFIAHTLATCRSMSQRVGVMCLGRLVEEGPADGVHANQLDPYPEALFSAPLPAHPTKVDEEEEVVLSGEVPTAFDIPSGCTFHPRWPYAVPECATEEPRPMEVAAGHVVACHPYGTGWVPAPARRVTSEANRPAGARPAHVSRGGEREG